MDSENLTFWGDFPGVVNLSRGVFGGNLEFPVKCSGFFEWGNIFWVVGLYSVLARRTVYFVIQQLLHQDTLMSIFHAAS